MTQTEQDVVVEASDASLLAQAAARNQHAFRTVYDRHVSAIRGYALGRVGPDAADDVVSEAFAIAWRSCAGFDPSATSARPWLYGIATNVVARHRDQERRWMERLEDSAPPTVDAPTAFELDPALCRAIAGLSPALRDVLLLTALADLSVAEAGRALGITATTARVRLLRARRILRQDLNGESHD